MEVWIRSWIELLWHQRQAPPLQQLLLFLPPSLLLCSQSARIFFTSSLLCLWFGWAPVLVWINVPALSCSFWFSHFVFLFFVFLFFLTRQPSCSPGKISLTAQRKSPSSMITRAYYKTLDKCQRGLRGGDLEDIWRRDRPPLTVAHTHSTKYRTNKPKETTQNWRIIFIQFIRRFTYLFKNCSSL